jgi:putative aminopeptidase FrvX
MNLDGPNGPPQPILEGGIIIAGRPSHSVAQTAHLLVFGAMLIAEEGALLVEAVTDNTDATMCACRCQRTDRTFEAIDGVGLTAPDHLKRLVVPTVFTVP